MTSFPKPAFPKPAFTRPAAIRSARRRLVRPAVAALLWGLTQSPMPSSAANERPRDAVRRPLTVAVPGGTVQDALQRAFFAPFAVQDRVGIRVTGWDGTLATLQRRVRIGADTADLLLMDNSSVLLACRQGLLLPLGLLQGAADGTTMEGASRCGRDAMRFTLVLAWDKSRIDAAPGWAEFWDVARRPGRRGLARGPRGTLEIALLADGVPADEVYAVLGSPEGVDRAFRKLDQLKPYVVWWNDAADAARIMQAGAVLMTSAPSGDVWAADLAGHRDFAVQPQGSISMLLSWAVPGRPAPAPTPGPRPGPTSEPAPRGDAGDRLARAEALLLFMADPARRAAFADLDSAGSSLPGTPSAPLAEDGPATPQRPPHGALRQDDAFWAAHLEALQARFDGWVGPPIIARPAP